MPQIGPLEVLLIVLVALLVFGPHKLPEVGRQVGSALRQLRSFQETIKGELDEVLHGDTATSTATGSTPSDSVTAGVEPPEASPAALPAPEPPAVTPAPPAPPSGRAPSRFRGPAQPPPSS